MCISAAMMMAISTGISVAGQVAQGQAKKEAGDAQAREFQIAADQNAVAAQQEAARIRKAGEKTAGAARAALAGAGIVVDQGSAVNINEDIYRNSETDAYNTLLTGERQSGSLMRKASQSSAEGNNSLTASLLSSGVTGAEGYAGWKRAARDPQTGERI
jgi:hypothetical protein